MRSAIKVASCAAALVIVIVIAAAVGTAIRRRAERDTTSDEQKLARTLGIIRSGSPSNRKVLKVLFYGQSITHSGWHQIVVDHWRQVYPNTVFVVQNRAIGGFASPALLRTTEQDIAAFYPDLIIFHVYGDHRAYEKIIRLFRSRTAADIIVQTDHGDVLPDPPCAEGLQLSLTRPAGCAGWGWLHQRFWNDEMSYHKIPALGKKYGLAIEPQRAWWRDYLLRTHVSPGSMLVDNLHPNQKGKELIAFFFNRYFDDLVARWNKQTESTVSSPAPDGNGQLDFLGTRLEMLSPTLVQSPVAVSLDGVSPAELDGCYQQTRATSVATVPDWPTLRRIHLQHDRTPEQWTATLTNISPDQKHFDFVVSGSVTGFDGKGNSDHDFVSRSGKISIDEQDWMLARAFELSHKPLSSPVESHWAVEYICGGQPEAIDLGNGSMQYRYVMAAGLPNGQHAAKLLIPNKGSLNGIEFRAYQPLLTTP